MSDQITDCQVLSLRTVAESGIKYEKFDINLGHIIKMISDYLFQMGNFKEDKSATIYFMLMICHFIFTELSNHEIDSRPLWNIVHNQKCTGKIYYGKVKESFDEELVKQSGIQTLEKRPVMFSQ